MKRYYNIFAALAITFACFVLPKAAIAATLSFSVDSGQVYAGDVLVASLNLDSMGEKINVAEATVYFDSRILEAEDVSTGGSIFSLWTRTPVYDNQAGKIIFTGGTAGNFSGSAGNVLKIVFVAKQKGQAFLNFADDSALYLADGKGTKISPHLANSVISVLGRPQNYVSKNQWDKLLTGDKISPKNLTITLGKDPSVFDGKYFISFSATDDGSGINYYAVKEGSGDFVQTESPYVLKDQSLSGIVTVKAVDKAGNGTVQTLNLKQYGAVKIWYIILMGVIGFIVLLAAVWMVKALRKNKK